MKYGEPVEPWGYKADYPVFDRILRQAQDAGRLFSITPNARMNDMRDLKICAYSISPLQRLMTGR